MQKKKKRNKTNKIKSKIITISRSKHVYDQYDVCMISQRHRLVFKMSVMVIVIEAISPFLCKTSVPLSEICTASLWLIENIGDDILLMAMPFESTSNHACLLLNSDLARTSRFRTSWYHMACSTNDVITISTPWSGLVHRFFPQVSADQSYSNDGLDSMRFERFTLRI